MPKIHMFSVKEIPFKERKGCCRFDCADYPKIRIDAKSGAPILDDEGKIVSYHNMVCLMCKFFKPFNFHVDIIKSLKGGKK